MQQEELRRRSRWMLRVMEWNDPRARYPNIWHGGLPQQILALETMARRLRLGDLIAAYYPASNRHPELSERFVGLVRVSCLRRSGPTGHAWIELEPAHRFAKPPEIGAAPRRVFMCCDPGWPEADVALFQAVFDRAVAEGFEPGEDELAPTPPSSVRSPAPRPEPHPSERMFAGADHSGNMRDPRDGTWLAVVGLHEDRLRLIRIDPVGRSGLHSALRDPGRVMMQTEAIGLGFPFALPVPFAETLMTHAFDERGWWALVQTLEKITWPHYLVALQKFREEHGELKRFADESAGNLSPLHRVDPDMGSRTYHGIRMIAEDRSRYAIRPFETAQGKLLLEVSPRGTLHRVGLAADASAEAIVETLADLPRWPVDLGPFRERCLRNRKALDAVLSARSTAVAVLTGEADRTPEELAPDRADQIRQEGWVYGLQESG